MELCFQKRIKIFKGLTLNLSKIGVSYSVGMRGAHEIVKDNKVVASAGITRAGISYRQDLTPSHPAPKAMEDQSTNIENYEIESKELRYEDLILILSAIFFVGWIYWLVHKIF